jgi:energy-coupling factor transporter transmembrane protein EcfT
MIGQIKSLLTHAEEYVEKNAELIKLKAVSTASETISYVITMFVIIGSILLFVFMLFVGLSILIGHALGKLEYGFFIMAAVMGIFCIILYANKESLLKSRVCDLLIKKILN